MDVFGFGPRWQSWISRIYRGLKTSFIVNEYPSEPARMAQGLRQGDPLSPLLAYLRRQLTGLVLPSFNLRTLAYADDMLVTVHDQVDVGMLESGLYPHTHTH
jgi:hypothetical protein